MIRKTSLVTIFAAFLFSAFSSNYANAGTREEAIKAASKLSETSNRLTRYARFRKYSSLEAAFAKIGKLADEAEIAARTQSKADTAAKANDIIAAYLQARADINKLPAIERLPIKRSARVRINNLGLLLFTNYVPVKMSVENAKKSQKKMTEEEILDDLKQGVSSGNWDKVTVAMEEVPGEDKFFGKSDAQAKKPGRDTKPGDDFDK